MALPTVVFSHGKESGPTGSKILAMVEVARDFGLETHSIDYRGVDDPYKRVQMCLDVVNKVEVPPILVGSSMGGYVSTAVASQIKVHAVFVLAPAFGMPGYPELTAPVCPIEIVHGWSDDVVPVENSIRFARENKVTLHLVDGGHRLNENIQVICHLLRYFLSAQTRVD